MLPQRKPERASDRLSREQENMSRVIKSKDELEDIVVRHLRARPASAGIAGVVVTAMTCADGGWTVKAFQEGSSTRGGCLLGLQGILPVLQAKFELGV